MTEPIVIQMLEQIIADQKAILQKLEARPTPTPVTKKAAAAKIEPANDDDLDSQYGDPEVRTDPKFGWQGDSYKGRHFSECPADYLTALASLLCWQAGKDEQEGKVTANGQPTAPFKLKDAARCLGWRRRKLAGATHAEVPAPSPTPTQDDLFDGDHVPF